MTKYKTWEVIKMLTENPDLKFLNVRVRKCIGTYWDKVKSMTLVWENGEPFEIALGTDSGNIHDEWIIWEE